MHFPNPIDFGALLEILEDHHRGDLPFALYRKPGSTMVRAVLQTDPRIVAPEHWGEPGFVMSPHDTGAWPVVHLQPDRLLQAFSSPSASPARVTCPPEAEEVRKAHLDRVSDALRAISDGHLEKVVLARSVSFALMAVPFRVFEKLLLYYPASFCYMWYHPATGLWMGATPELLLSFAQGEARTVSLAGTLPVEGNLAPAFGKKERHEQQVVTDYICRRLREQGLNPQVGQTQTVQAGSLWHLRTPVSVQADPGQLGQLLDALHPTPAVCGMPLSAARQFIERHEGFDRAYYTGYLGPCGLEAEGQAEFYVNLRCMKMGQGQAFLFVGGGITEGSDPAREWEETRQKCATVWAAVKNSG